MVGGSPKRPPYFLGLGWKFHQQLQGRLLGFNGSLDLQGSCFFFEIIDLTFTYRQTITTNSNPPVGNSLKRVVFLVRELTPKSPKHSGLVVIVVCQDLL